MYRPKLRGELFILKVGGHEKNVTILIRFNLHEYGIYK